MATTIVATILMNRRSSVHHEHVRQTVSVALIIVASRQHGIVMEMTIVAIKLMNQKIIARAKNEHALVIFSHATMATAFREFIFVMAIMIVWTVPTKIRDIS